MLRIGLIGGMTPESTKDYYDMLMEMSRERLEGNLNNPEMIIYSINLSVMVAHFKAGQREKVVAMMADVMERLRIAGAEIGAMTANTPHVLFDEIAKGTELPLISIIETTHDRAKEMGCRKALLLGTRTTMASDMYPKRFERSGMGIMVPDEEERDFIDGSISDELSIGIVRPETKARYIDICKRYLATGADTVILGCTEIPMVLKEGDLQMKVLNPARVHAEAIFERALQG